MEEFVSFVEAVAVSVIVMMVAVDDDGDCCDGIGERADDSGVTI